MVRRSASAGEMERVSELADWDRSALGRAGRRASILLARRCPVRQSRCKSCGYLSGLGGRTLVEVGTAGNNELS